MAVLHSKLLQLAIDNGRATVIAISQIILGRMILYYKAIFQSLTG